MRHLAELGIRVLANADIVLKRDGGALVVAGVTDRSAPATGRQGPDLAAALVAAPPDAPIVRLDHQPTKWAAMRANALAFLDKHGAEAHRLGWTPAEASFHPSLTMADQEGAICQAGA